MPNLGGSGSHKKLRGDLLSVNIQLQNFKNERRKGTGFYNINYEPMLHIILIFYY